MKFGTTQAAVERDKAVREVARLRRELEQEENDREHVSFYCQICHLYFQ